MWLHAWPVSYDCSLVDRLLLMCWAHSGSLELALRIHKGRSQEENNPAEKEEKYFCPITFLFPFLISSQSWICGCLRFSLSLFLERGGFLCPPPPSAAVVWRGQEITLGKTQSSCLDAFGCYDCFLWGPDLARHAQGADEAENQGQADEGKQRHTRLVSGIITLKRKGRGVHEKWMEKGKEGGMESLLSMECVLGKEADWKLTSCTFRIGRVSALGMWRLGTNAHCSLGCADARYGQQS